jgi:hypothetical protein
MTDIDKKGQKNWTVSLHQKGKKEHEKIIYVFSYKTRQMISTGTPMCSVAIGGEC